MHIVCLLKLFDGCESCCCVDTVQFVSGAQVVETLKVQLKRQRMHGQDSIDILVDYFYIHMCQSQTNITPIAL